MSLEEDAIRIDQVLREISQQVVQEKFLPNAPKEKEFASLGDFRRALHLAAEPAFKEFERQVEQRLPSASDKETYQLFRDHYFQEFYSGRVLDSVRVQ